MGIPSIKIGMNVESIALGAAIFLFGPAVLSVAGGLFRSVAKCGVKGGLILYDKGKELAAGTKEKMEELAAEAKESIEDLAAEARAEVSGETKHKARR